MDKDIENGLKATVYAVAGLYISPKLGFLAFLGIAVYFGLAGLHALFTKSESEIESEMIDEAISRRAQIQTTNSAPITDEPTIADRIKEIHVKNDFKCPSCGAVVLPTDLKCKHCSSILVDTVNLPRPEKWSDIEVGQPVTVKHPKRGEMNLSVQNRTYYGELWQAQMRQNVPWTLTGAYYVGLGLEQNIFLMNWQSRFYMLDSCQPLTDMTITRDFAPYARQFAGSNQTAKIFFPYQGMDWRMEDIGRFRIEYAEGDGIKVSPGAVGRFVHASRDNKVMVVEDYQTGGSGLDNLWIGYQIAEQDVQF